MKNQGNIPGVGWLQRCFDVVQLAFWPDATTGRMACESVTIPGQRSGAIGTGCDSFPRGWIKPHADADDRSKFVASNWE